MPNQHKNTENTQRIKSALGLCGVALYFASAVNVVAANPSPADARIAACGAGLESRRTQAKAAFAKKDYDGAYNLLDYCSGLFPPGNPASKEHSRYYIERTNASIAKEKAKKKREGVRVGMSKQDVIDSSWGRPQSINKITSQYSNTEIWGYGSSILYFEDGKLSVIQN